MGTSSSKGNKNQAMPENASTGINKATMRAVEDATEPYMKLECNLSNYKPKVAVDTRWDIFVSHRQLNGGAHCHALFQHLTHAQAVRVCYDNSAKRLNEAGIEKAVCDSKYVLVFVTDGIFDRPNCIKEISWAIKYNKPIIMMRETDPRHGGMSFGAFSKQVPADLRETLQEGEWINFEPRGPMFIAAIMMLLNRCSITPVPEATRDIFANASRGSTVTPNLLGSQYQPGTRQWLFDAVRKWHTNRQGGVGSHVFTLAGLSGVGKSVFASTLCCRGSKDFGSYDEGSLPVAAFHFFKHDAVTDRSARQALLSIASQLRRSVPGFADALLHLNLDEAALRDTWSLKEVFDNVIAKPAGMVKISEHTVVVIDALDECSKAAAFCQLLQKYWTAQILPKWLGLFITSRPEYQDGWLTEVSKINSEDHHNTEDIASFLRVKLRDDAASAEDMEGMVAKLLQLSEGIFLYMRFLGKFLDEARQRKRASIARLRNSTPKSSSRRSKRANSNDTVMLTASDFFEFPKGMGGALAEYFQRLSVALGPENYGRVLAPVANVREPLPMLLWMRCVKFDKYRGTARRLDKKAVKGFDRIHQHCRDLLVETMDPVSGTHTVRFIHKSMSDWLTGSESDAHDSALKQGYTHLSVSLDAEGHASLCKHMTQLAKEDGGNAILEAALSFTARHRFYHLCKVEDFDQAASILFDFKHLLLWLDTGGVNSVLQDIEMQLLLNDAAQDQKNIMVQQGSIVANVLRLGVGSIGTDPRTLAGQIVGRLSVEDVASKKMDLVKQLRDQAWCYKPAPALDGTLVRWVRPLVPCLESAMPRISHHTNSGHAKGKALKDYTESVAFAPDASVGHTDVVGCVLYSPDGKIIVSAFKDNSLRLWNAETGTAKLGGKPLEGHTSPVLCVAFSKDNTMIASGSGDNTVILWDVETGEAKLTLEGESVVQSVAFSPDGITIVCGSWDNTVRLWDSRTGEPKLWGMALNGHAGPVRALAFAPDGQTYVSGSSDNTMRLWNTDSWEARLDGRALQGHSGRVLSVVYSPDGRTVVSGSEDKTVRVWDAQTGAAALNGRALHGHSQSVLSVAFSLDGKYIFSESEDQTVRLWDAVTGKPKVRANGASSEGVPTFGENHMLCPGGDPNTIGLKLDQVSHKVKGYCRNDGQWRMCVVRGDKITPAFLETV